MPYVALYRKYRSQAFEDVIGQEHVTRTLQNAIESQKIGQAYLFTGSRGCGKTTVARLLAKAVNCQNGPTAHPCNTCDICVSITRGSAVDVAEVDAASNRGVSEMEAICDGVRYQPMEARYRVVILDEAHQLSDHAKDAFLKTLEEPPPHALFVLATTEPSKIPITIRSRCQQFDFRRGSLKQIEDRLRWVCDQEGVKISDDAARLIAAHAQGSWRDGLSLLEQVIAFSGQDVTAEHARKVLGAVPEEVPTAILAALSANDGPALLEETRKSWGAGADPARLLAALVEYCRDRLEDLLAKRSASDNVQSLNADQLIKLIYSLAESESSLRHWERADLAIEVALLSAMAVLHRPQQASPVSQAPPAQQAPTAARPAPPARQAPPSRPAPPQAPEPAAAETASPASPTQAPVVGPGPAAEGPADLDMIQRAWPRVIQRLNSERSTRSLCAILKDGQPSAFKNGTVTIGFPTSHSFHAQRTQTSADKVAEAFKYVAGIDVKVKADASAGQGDASSTASPAKKPSSAQSAGAKQKAETPASELVDEVLKTFGGEVLDDQDPFSS